METGVSARFGVRLVIFHYRDPVDRDRLGRLLRQFDGATVQLQAGSGPWHTATVLRLKNCFGRGLLVFSNSEPALNRGDTFLVRFPRHH